MKVNRSLLALFSILWIVTIPLLVTSCCHTVPDQKSAVDSTAIESSLHLKYKMNGSFDGWTNCKVAETARNMDWDKVQFHSAYPDPGLSDTLKIRCFFYDNDEKYLYVFFKLDRSLDQIYGNRYVGCGLGELFFDLDMDTNTGCGACEKAGGGTLAGSELRVQILGGFFARNGNVGRYVSYDEANWDPVAQRFDKDVNHQDSIDASRRLIAYGKDGIELAIPIDAFNTKAGRFNMAYCPMWLSREQASWNLVILKK